MLVSCAYMLAALDQSAEPAASLQSCYVHFTQHTNNHLMLTRTGLHNHVATATGRSKEQAPPMDRALMYQHQMQSRPAYRSTLPLIDGCMQPTPIRPPESTRRTARLTKFQSQVRRHFDHLVGRLPCVSTALGRTASKMGKPHHPCDG